MSDNENSIQNIQQESTETKNSQGIGKVFLILFIILAIAYSFYVAIYIAGDHEHIITVTCKEEIYNEGKNFYYVYGINEKGKESVYEIGSRWVNDRKGCTDEDLWVQIKEGQTYRVRATGLCWGLEAEPLISPITVVPDGDASFVNDIKNPVILVGTALTVILVFSIWLLFWLLSRENFITSLFGRNRYNNRFGLSANGLICVYSLIVFIFVFRTIIVKIADMYYMY